MYILREASRITLEGRGCLTTVFVLAGFAVRSSNGSGLNIYNSGLPQHAGLHFLLIRSLAEVGGGSAGALNREALIPQGNTRSCCPKVASVASSVLSS